MLSISVTADIRQVERMLTRLERTVVPKATVRALNKTGITVRKEGSQAIRKDRKLKARDVKKRLVIFRANRHKMSVIISGSGKAVPLGAYPARQVKRGVRVNVKGTRKLVKGAFIATMRSGHKGVFKRRGPKRLPVDELYSTTVADAMKNPRVRSAMHSAAVKRFRRVFEQELRHAISRM